MVNAPPDMIPGMQADDALTLLSALDERGVHYWLDGGWGVDCLLGEQTRTHNDLDLVVHRQDVDDVMRLLNAQGYDVIRDWLPTSIAFRDRSGREVDLHPVDPTPDGGRRPGAARRRRNLALRATRGGHDSRSAHPVRALARPSTDAHRIHAPSR